MGRDGWAGNVSRNGVGRDMDRDVQEWCRQKDVGRDGRGRESAVFDFKKLPRLSKRTTIY